MTKFFKWWSKTHCIKISQTVQHFKPWPVLYIHEHHMMNHSNDKRY